MAAMSPVDLVHSCTLVPLRCDLGVAAWGKTDHGTLNGISSCEEHGIGVLEEAQSAVKRITHICSGMPGLALLLI